MEKSLISSVIEFILSFFLCAVETKTEEKQNNNNNEKL